MHSLHHFFFTVGKRCLPICPFCFATFNALHWLVRESPLYWWGRLFEALASATDWYQLAIPFESIMLKWHEQQSMMSCCWCSRHLVEHFRLTHHHQSKHILLQCILRHFRFLSDTSSGVRSSGVPRHLWVAVLEMLFPCDIIEFLGRPISLFLMVYAWVFFSPLASRPKLETKQEQSNVTWSVFQKAAVFKVKISLTTGLAQKHLLRLTSHFFLMGAEGVRRAGFGQQRKF